MSLAALVSLTDLLAFVQSIIHVIGRSRFSVREVILSARRVAWGGVWGWGKSLMTTEVLGACSAVLRMKDS